MTIRELIVQLQECDNLDLSVYVTEPGAYFLIDAVCIARSEDKAGVVLKGD